MTPTSRDQPTYHAVVAAQAAAQRTYLPASARQETTTTKQLSLSQLAPEKRRKRPSSKIIDYEFLEGVKYEVLVLKKRVGGGLAWFVVGWIGCCGGGDHERWKGHYQVRLEMVAIRH